MLKLINLLKIFVDTNIRLSEFVDSLFIKKKRDFYFLKKLFSENDKTLKIADVGGGKKPAKVFIKTLISQNSIYDGYDISMDELNLAKDYYSDVYKIDLSKPKKISKQYDIVLCLNTLEHVKNTSVAINNLGNMLNKNGLLYIKVPNRRAIFARLNLLLPSKLKKRILHLLFPLKSGDGFDAYYNYCEPTEMTHVLNQNQFVIKDIMLYKYSMYFTFFFPIYLSWRFLTIFQIIFNKNYCESFEIIAIKK